MGVLSGKFFVIRLIVIIVLIIIEVIIVLLVKNICIEYGGLGEND